MKGKRHLHQVYQQNTTNGLKSAFQVRGLQPKPIIRTRRFFPVKPGLLLEDLLDDTFSLERRSAQRSNSKQNALLPTLKTQATSRKSFYSSRKACNLQPSMAQIVEPPKKRLLSPKILKFRSGELAKRSRIFSADSKLRSMKDTSGLMFTFGQADFKV